MISASCSYVLFTTIELTFVCFFSAIFVGCRTELVSLVGLSVSSNYFHVAAMFLHQANDRCISTVWYLYFGKNILDVNLNLAWFDGASKVGHFDPHYNFTFY